ncbi:MAG TPA: hypothetical protein VHX17_05550 [Candidatus Cybelea sp.]|nr:hypothetical protein [Candidatus Cybelea sp.]
MTNALRRCALLVACVALTAQTPAPGASPLPEQTPSLLERALSPLPAQSPGPTPTPGKPIRQLEYAFSVGVQGVQNYAVEPGGTGVQTVDKGGHIATPEGGTGKMYVDVLSVASDGALVVRISELVRGDARPRQAFTCSVYGNTSVLCPATPSPSDAEWVLLSYLGRQFVDGAPWTDKGQWQRSEQSDQFQTTEDFTLVDASPKRAVVREVKKMELHNGGFDNQTSDVTITYDRTLEVPTLIHDDVVTTGGDEASHAKYEFTLKNDSMKSARPHATPKP